PGVVGRWEGCEARAGVTEQVGLRGEPVRPEIAPPVVVSVHPDEGGLEGSDRGERVHERVREREDRVLGHGRLDGTGCDGRTTGLQPRTRPRPYAGRCYRPEEDAVWREGYVAGGDTRFFVRALGHGDDLALLLHGWPEDGSSW